MPHQVEQEIYIDRLGFGFTDMVQSIQQYSYLLAICGGLVSRLAMLAVLIILPSRIGLQEYGFFVLVITIGEIIEMISSNWYRIILVRQGVNYVSKSEVCHDSGSNTVKRHGFLTAIWGGTLVALTAAFLVTPVFADEQKNTPLTGVVMSYIVAFLFFKLIVAVLQAQKQQQLIGALEMLRGIFMIVFIAAVLLWAPQGFFFPALAIIFSTIIAGFAGLFTAGSGLRALLGQAIHPDAFYSVGLPIIVVTVLTFQLGWIDRLVLQKLLGPEAIGLYVAVAAIARQPLDLLLNALNTQTFPVMMERSESSREYAGQRASGVLVSACILGIGGAGALIVMANVLARVFLPEFDTALASLLIPTVALGALLLGIKSFVFDNIFHAHGRSWQMLRWFAIISGATLLISIIAISRYGVPGAAFAFTGGSAMALLSSFLVSRRVFAFPVPWTALAKVVTSAIMAGSAALACKQYLDMPSFAVLVICSLAFATVYLASLYLLLRFSLRKFLSAPWEIDYATGVAR